MVFCSSPIFCSHLVPVAGCGKWTCTVMVNLSFCSQQKITLLKYFLFFGNHCRHLQGAGEQILYKLSQCVFIYSFILVPCKLDKDLRVVAFFQAKNILWIFGLNYMWLLDFWIIVLYNKAIVPWTFILNKFFHY